MARPRSRFNKPDLSAEAGRRSCSVASTVIADLTYDRNDGAAVVTFQSGAKYVYPGMTHQRFTAWCAAPSKGRYLNKVIKGAYNYKRIG